MKDLFRAAIGTAHGFALFDYKVGKATFKKCLLTPAGTSCLILLP